MIALLRMKQWYKNLVIFLAIFFVGKAFDVNWLILTLVGFFSLCFVSSATYIINDIKDRAKDRLHPEKKFRPIAAGKVSVKLGWIIAVLLFVLGAGIAYYLSFGFFVVVLMLFFLSQLYTFWLKNKPIVDILMISINFVLRAISGTYILDVSISPWLIICTFFLSLFLVSGKREADLALGGKIVSSRKVLKYYTPKVTKVLTIFSAVLLMISYALYSIFSQYSGLLLSLPIALYVMWRYLSLIRSGSYIARHPENSYKDIWMVLGLILWVLVVFFVIYFL